MTLTELKPSFLSLSESEQLELILKVRESRSQFKKNSQTRQSKARVSAEKKAKKTAEKTLSGLSLKEKIQLLKELQNEG